MSEQNFNEIWSGRVDADEPADLATRLHQVIKPLATDPTGVQVQSGPALIGFCSDEGVRRNQGRVGAAQAPDRLRRALANLPWAPERAAYDAGNVECEGQQLEAAHQTLADRVQHCLSGGHFPLVLGGGHEMAFGTWLGLFRHFEAKGERPRIGIVNFDAHFDLRPDGNGASSGTPFYQIARQCRAHGQEFRYCCLGVSEVSNTAALFRRADELGVSYRRDTEMGLLQLEETIAQLQRFIETCDLLYLTIDLDVLPAGVAPGVSAPAARGVGLEILEPLIDLIRHSGKLKIADIAEYNPTFDIDNWTARAAARLIHFILK